MRRTCVASSTVAAFGVSIPEAVTNSSREARASASLMAVDGGASMKDVPSQRWARQSFVRRTVAASAASIPVDAARLRADLLGAALHMEVGSGQQQRWMRAVW